MEISCSARESRLLTHYWLDDRFPNANTVTKAACQDMKQLMALGRNTWIKKEWIHVREGFPHFDLIGESQERILQKERSLETFRSMDYILMYKTKKIPEG